MYIYILALEVIIITQMHISSWEDMALEVTVLCKEYGCNLQDT